MRDWLIRKAQNSRINMCIKEVKWSLESSDLLHRATVLSMAQLFRDQALSEAIPHAVLDSPFNRTREELMTYYVEVEDLRNLSAAKLSDTQRGFKRVGMELPQVAVDHAKSCNRGLEVWMCTIGAGVVPERRDDVQKIWMYLEGAAAQIPAAISHLRDVARRTDDAMFGRITDQAWTMACSFFPSAFVSGA